MKVSRLNYKSVKEIVESPYFQGVSGNGKDYEVYKDELLQHYWNLQDRRLSIITDPTETFIEAPFKLSHKAKNTYLKTKNFVYIVSDDGTTYYRTR
jgi:hypothetical protein